MAVTLQRGNENPRNLPHQAKMRIAAELWRKQDALGVLIYTHVGPGVADQTLTEERVAASMVMIVER